ANALPSSRPVIDLSAPLLHAGFPCDSTVIRWPATSPMMSWTGSGPASSSSKWARRCAACAFSPAWPFVHLRQTPLADALGARIAHRLRLRSTLVLARILRWLLSTAQKRRTTAGAASSSPPRRCWTSTAWTRRRETTRSPGHLLDKLRDRGRQKRPPRRRGQESWENCGEAIRFARGGAQCFPWITKEWPALPLRSVPSSQSLTPALWCHVLSALLQAPRGIPGFIVAQSGRDEKEMPHGLTPSELPSVPTERHSRVARFSATNCADRAR